MRLLLLFILSTLVCSAQTPELTVQLGHSKLIYDVAYSPDGKFVASASADRTVKIWELEEGREVLTLRIDEGYATSVQFAANSKELLVGGGSYDIGELKIYDLETATVVTEFKGHEEYAWNAEFSSDGKRVFSASFDQTVKCWDRKTGKMLYTTDELPGLMRQLSVDPLGEYVAVTCDDSELGASLWKTEDLSFVRQLLVDDELFESRTIKFSGDGQYIIVGDWSKNVAVFERESSEPIYVKEAHNKDQGNLIRCLGTDPSGNYFFSGSSDRLIHQFEIKTGTLVATYTGHQDEVYAIDIHPFKQTFMSGGSFDKSIKEWDMKSKELIRNMNGNVYPVRDLELSPDGNQLLINSYDRFGGDVYGWRLDRMDQMVNLGDPAVNYTDMWSNETDLILTGSNGDISIFNYDGLEARETYTMGQPVYNPLIHTTNEKLLVGLHEDPYNRSSLVSIYEYDPDKHQLYHFSYNRDRLPGNQALGFTDDGKHYFILESNWENNQINKYEIDTDTLVTSIVDSNHLFPDLALSHDGNRIILYSNSKATLIQAETGEVLWHIGEDLPAPLQDVHFINEHLALLSGGDWSSGFVYLIDIDQKHILKKREDFQTAQGAVTYDPKRKLVISGGDDARVTLMAMDDLSTQLTLFAFADGKGEWAAIHPSGLFDGSKEAIEHYLYFTYKLEPIQLFQLKERYYEPGLIQKVLGYHSEPLRDISRFNEVKLYPKADLSIERDTLYVQLQERSGGIGRVSFLINGKEMLEDFSTNFHSFSETQSAFKTARIKLENYSKFLVPGSSNRLEVMTTNTNESITSPAYSIAYDAPEVSGFGAARERPRLHALIVGTSDYRGTQLDLKYAAKDAQDVAHALTVGGEKLFGEDMVHIHVLHTDSEEPEWQPTKTNIEAHMRQIAEEARPEDVILLYFSGHGVTYGGTDAQFHYLTKDVESGDISDAVIRSEYTVSTGDMTSWINAVPAQKQIMILDACASGQAVEDLLAVTKNVNSSQIKALDKMKDRTGLFIVAGSASDKVSFEASQYGQSLLTYSLLSGLNIISAKSEDKMVDLVEWLNYSRDKVPELASSIGGVQEPVIALPRNLNSFDIVHLPDPTAIRVAESKPVFVRTTLMDLEEQDDILGLSEHLDGYFQELSVKGRSAEIIFVDVKKFPAAYSIRGFYEVMGDEVDINATVRKGDEKLGKVNLTGQRTDIEGLIDAIMNDVNALIKD